MTYEVEAERIRSFLAALATALVKDGRDPDAPPDQVRNAYRSGVGDMVDAAEGVFLPWLLHRAEAIDNARNEVVSARTHLNNACIEIGRLQIQLSLAQGEQDQPGTSGHQALIDAAHAEAIAEIEARRLSNGIMAAWGVIANAGEGSWDRESPSWREAAQRWRDTYMP